MNLLSKRMISWGIALSFFPRIAFSATTPSPSPSFAAPKSIEIPATAPAVDANAQAPLESVPVVTPTAEASPPPPPAPPTPIVTAEPTPADTVEAAAPSPAPPPPPAPVVTATPTAEAVAPKVTSTPKAAETQVVVAPSPAPIPTPTSPVAKEEGGDEIPLPPSDNPNETAPPVVKAQESTPKEPVAPLPPLGEPPTDAAVLQTPTPEAPLPVPVPSSAPAPAPETAVAPPAPVASPTPETATAPTATPAPLPIETPPAPPPAQQVEETTPGPVNLPEAVEPDMTTPHHVSDNSGESPALIALEKRIPAYQLAKPNFGVQLTGSPSGLGGTDISTGTKDGGTGGPGGPGAFLAQMDFQPAIFQGFGVLGFGPQIGLYPYQQSSNVSTSIAGIFEIGAQLRYQARFFHEQLIVPEVALEAQIIKYTLQNGAAGQVLGKGGDIGVYVNLNSLEPSSALEMFRTYGISRSYLVVELRDLSGNNTDVNFSGPSFFFGLRTEW